MTQSGQSSLGVSWAATHSSLRSRARRSSSRAPDTATGFIKFSLICPRAATPADAVAGLAKDRKFLVRSAVAQREDLASGLVREMIGNDPSPYIRADLLRRHDLPEEEATEGIHRIPGRGPNPDRLHRFRPGHHACGRNDAGWW